MPDDLSPLLPRAHAADHDKPDRRPRWRHKKRGTVYVVLGIGCFQTTESEKLDEQLVVIYQAEGGGCVFVRPAYEFEDGRFERVTP